MLEDFRTMEFRNGELILIDQRVLPKEYTFFTCRTYQDVEFAIREMVVRGAPAIGAVAAYGAYFAYIQTEGEKHFYSALEFLNNARPTAVNLAWAIEKMRKVYLENRDRNDLADILLAEADRIRVEDIETNIAIGKAGAAAVRPGATILTHCNTGALATAGWGTALGVIKQAHEDGKNIFVYADETRPRLQGARLTAWELVRARIPCKLIPDSAAATLIRDGRIDCVILGADRIASNGDFANKLGTFALSVICKHYGVPFYSAAPFSTIDLSIKSGKEIPIEERDKDEVRKAGSEQLAPPEVDVYNPCFDVTPHENLTGIITEKGIIYPPFDINIRKLSNE